MFRSRAVRGVVALLVAGGLLGAAPLPAADASGLRSFTLQVREHPADPGDTSTIGLHTDLYTPAAIPAPAVLLAHGFGQTKQSVRSVARHLQRDGYVVLAYTARGFGRSGGEIGLDSLDGEVPDARAMVDVLDRSPAVLHRGGDPVVAAVGGSYGGALALMAGATDPRIDTVVAAITWNELGDALAPPSAGRTSGGGTPLRDFKSGWGSRLFGAGIAGADAPCGRFTPAFCDLYRRLVAGGQPTAADLALLARSSPRTVLDRLHVPTLLLQGLQDGLFGLDQSDATERQLAAAGTPVRTRWFDGGHDGGGTTGIDLLLDGWLADHLRARRPVPREFTFAVPATATSFGGLRTAGRYAGLDGDERPRRIALRGPVQTAVNPPGGQPAAVTGIPGLGTSSTTARTATGLLAQATPSAPGASFASAPLTAPALLTGSPRLRLRVARTDGAAGTAVLYAQLTVRTGDAERAFDGGVAPIRVALPAGGTVVDVRMPATVQSLAPGDRLVLTLRTSDSQFVGQRDPAAYRIALAGPVVLPAVRVRSASGQGGLPSTGVLIGIVVALLVAAGLVLAAVLLGRRRRPAPPPAEPREEAAPLEIRGLTKRFRSGFLAVDDVGFSVARGQVVGLLGENGAGKTTTLRMVTGLMRPDAGEVRAFGAPVVPGAAVLARLGVFIEGPGFLPHLSGRRNLELYWAATGRRRSEARFDEALAVADLGGAVRKPVRGYSQGMRQRLAIAQAMLGMPDLLVLDEPTNGLDPPQITALREVLRRYAEGGRTVVVSSHLLGEVERTCSHVVVMSHGRVVAAGPVEEVAGDSAEVTVAVGDVSAALAAVRALPIERAEARGAEAVRVAPGAVGVDAVVAAIVGAGVGVTGVERGRHLEEAFLDLIGATEPSA